MRQGTSPLAVGIRCPLSAPSQAPGPRVLQTSPAGMSRSWTQTAKQGMMGRLLTSSSNRKEWRERPPQTRRMRMQGGPLKRKRLWTLWASCGRSPCSGEPILLAGSRFSGDESSLSAGSQKAPSLGHGPVWPVCWGTGCPLTLHITLSLRLGSGITCPFLVTGWPPTATPWLCTEAWQSCPLTAQKPGCLNPPGQPRSLGSPSSSSRHPVT